MKKTHNLIFLFILFPALLSVVFSFISLFSFRGIYKEQLKDSYTRTLKNFSQKEEQSISDIAYSIRILSENRQFTDTATGANVSEDNIRYTRDILQQISKNHEIIDSIFIADKVNGMVYTEYQTYKFNDYFTNIYSYKNYNADYWKELTALSRETKTLPPTNVKTLSAEKTIIPLIFAKIGEKYTSNIIVVNVNVNSLLENFKSYSGLENSTISIMNKTTFQNFYESGSEVITDTGLTNQLTSEISNNADCTIYGKKSFLVSYSPSYTTLGYVYLIATPNSVIRRSTPLSLNILFVFNILIFIIILLLCFKETKTIYSPFKKLQNLFPNRSESFSDLHSAVVGVIESNEKMQQQLCKTLPIIEEQKLIRFLNSTEHYTDLSEFDLKNFSWFVNDYFCSVVIKLSPTKVFYEKYSELAEKTIEIGIYDLIKTEFLQAFEHMYIIPSDEHTLYIILNPDRSDTGDEVSEIVKRIENAFSYDSSDIAISISAGSVKFGLEGLRKSHNEALNNLFVPSPFTHVHVRIDKKRETNISFTFADETALYNHLVASNIEKSAELMKKKYSEYVYANTSPKDFCKLFTQYFNLIFKVLRQKNIEYDSEQYGDDALINNILKSDKEEIWNNIYTLLDILKNQNETNKIDVNNIIKYIQENYNKDIYQEQVAEIFHTSPSYLSRLIKKETSVTFSKYINILRINKAKELLQNNKMTVKEVYEAVGFNNRNTFIRTFKSIVGSTPSEYKQNRAGDNT